MILYFYLLYFEAFLFSRFFELDWARIETRREKKREIHDVRISLVLPHEPAFNRRMMPANRAYYVKRKRNKNFCGR